MATDKDLEKLLKSEVLKKIKGGKTSRNFDRMLPGNERREYREQIQDNEPADDQDLSKKTSRVRSDDD